MALGGILVPTLTPMDAAGERLHVEAVAPLVEFLVARGMNGLFVNGTTGEGPLLTAEERRLQVEATVAAAAGRVPVVVHVGALTTAESVGHARHAARAGAAAVACTPPYFFAYSDEELGRHFRAVARAVPETPCYLYTIPARTGNGISPALAARLAGEPNVAGMKDSSGDLALLRAYLDVPDFTVLCGSDPLALVALQAGASGTVSGPANVFPELYRRFWEAWRQGDAAAALRAHGLVHRLAHLVGNGARLDIFKLLAARRVPGLGTVRPPLRQADAAEATALLPAILALLRESDLPEEAYGWLE